MALRLFLELCGTHWTQTCYCPGRPG